MDVASPLNGPVMPDEAAIRALPKAEVHVHLEGTFELADLLELSKAAGEPLPGPARSLLDVSKPLPGRRTRPPLPVRRRAARPSD